MTRLSARLPLSLLLPLALVACARAPLPVVPDPAARVHALAAAIEADDPAAALDLLDPSTRSAEADARFRALWQDNRAELHELAQQLRGRRVRVRAGARVALASGEEVSVTLEQGRWRIAGGVLDAQARATPLDAVSALRRALLRQDLGALLRVLSRERRAAFAASFDRGVQQTADPLDLEVEQQGDVAIVRTSGGGEIRLRRQGERWYVEEVR